MFIPARIHRACATTPKMAKPEPRRDFVQEDFLASRSPEELKELKEAIDSRLTKQEIKEKIKEKGKTEGSSLKKGNKKPQPLKSGPQKRKTGKTGARLGMIQLDIFEPKSKIQCSISDLREDSKVIQKRDSNQSSDNEF